MKKIIALLCLFSVNFVYAEVFGTRDMWTSKKIKNGVQIQGTVSKNTALKIDCQKNVYYINATLMVEGKNYQLYWEGEPLKSTFKFLVNQNEESEFGNVMDGIEHAEILEVLYGSERKALSLPTKHLAKNIRLCRNSSGG